MSDTSITSDRHPQVLAVIREQDAAANAHSGVPAAVWELSRAACDTLLSWRAPIAAVLGALLTPLLEHELVEPDELARRFGREPVVLASRLVEHRLSAQSGATRAQREAVAQHSLRLRGFLRQAYLDLPVCSFMSLVLAYQDACVSQQCSVAVATETDAVFVPLAAALGVWSLRRRWLDLSLRTLAPDECAEMEDILGRPQGNVHGGVRESSSSSVVRPQRKRTRRRPREDSNGSSFDRNLVYADLECAFVETCRRWRVHPRPRLQMIPQLPGASLWRCRHGDSKSEMATRLGIRVFCHSVQDCYRVLGIVHSLGKPVAPRYSERVDDYIASPQPNGYQALHTAIMYQGTPRNYPETLVEVRILTPAMHRLNEYGFVAALYDRPALYRRVNAWWSDDQGHLKPLIGAHDLGTRSDTLYVFTPRGQVVRLPDGSTPLDFAYHIHTQLGHCASAVEVNGQTVPHNYPLRNGDLVRVTYDSRFQGPDLSWLGFVKTRSARAKIRRGLRHRAESVHPGRARLEELVMRTVQRYRRDRGYDLAITTAGVDAFLVKWAHYHRYADLTSLYADIAGQRLSVDKLVQRLVSEELACALVDVGCKRLPYPPHRIAVCSLCRPVPGNAIVGIEHRSRGRTRRLVVHVQGADKCLTGSNPQDYIPLRWVGQSTADGEELVLFDIEAQDRRRLLDDLLEEIYAEAGAYLYYVEARVEPDGGARVQLTVGAPDIARLAEIQQHLLAVRTVRQVVVFPASPSQRRAFASSHATWHLNPYTEGEVSDRLMFFGREPQVEQIKSWLAHDAPPRWLILHGKRRVGKTSLARYLRNEVLIDKHLAMPVIIDLQGLSRFAFDGIANYLADAVYRELGRQPPERRPYEEPVPWVSRALEETKSDLGKCRLLLMLDEFNVLMDRERCGSLDAGVFPNLRALINERSDTRWMLIVPDTHLRDLQSFGRAGSLLQQGTDLELTHLDDASAFKLLTEPPQRCGVRWQSDQLCCQVIELTSGNPYLIQALCFRLIDRVRQQGRATIMPDDLLAAVDSLLSAGRRYFDHFIRNLDTTTLAVLATIADMWIEGQWMDGSLLTDRLEQRHSGLTAESIDTAMTSLECSGAVSLRREQGIEEFRITVPLFHRWARQHMGSRTDMQLYQHRLPGGDAERPGEEV